MKYKIAFVFLILWNVSSGQSSIPEILKTLEFKGDTIKVVYDWVTDNIRYDVAKLNRMKAGEASRGKKNFKSQEERNAYNLKKTLSRKKGVCQDYSLLFDEMMKALNYKSFIVTGYTKNRKGKINTGTGHAWNAVKVNGQWKLFDTTWGAGYVENNRKFVKRYNQNWFDVDPDKMIEDHMPYDPIWQLLPDPMSYKGFKEGTKDPAGFVNFNFDSEIDAFLASNGKEKTQNILQRSEQCGDGISLVRKWRKSMSKRLDFQNTKEEALGLQDASIEFSNASSSFKKYLNAKNKRFRGSLYKKEGALKNLQEAEKSVESCLAILKGLKFDDKKLKSSVKRNIRNSEELQERIEIELEEMEGSSK